ncbi:glutathione S-transferase T3-like [Vicia villosa]|uniref:glutathione S-transferase T3-like n=1 Tax=Vicia villosa TaxID=3911 RepID=UPI00273BF004|nr:glutathione S-transferase T3-like [Vicia villosa]
MVSSGSVESFNNVSQFSTQNGLENIKLDEGQNFIKKKSRTPFSKEEDTLLIQPWLNMSKDPIVGVDQKASGFWLRVRETYNTYHDQLLKRENGQLKARWHRFNGRVQKFLGCYTSIFNKRKSGACEDEPKWKGGSIENSSKRTKVNNCGEYSSSSNLWTPIDCSDYDQASPITRPMEQQEAKKNSKGKSNATSFNVDLSAMENVVTERNAIMIRMAKARESDAIARVKEASARELKAKAMKAKAKSREDENETRWYEILFKDTSTMNETQLQDHEFYCNHIKVKL